MKVFFRYLSFLAKSTNQHGIHSPFIYRLTTDCFYAKTDPKVLRNLKSTKRRFKLSGSLKKPALMQRLLTYLSPKTACSFTATASLSAAVIERRDLTDYYVFSWNNNPQSSDFLTQQPKPFRQFYKNVEKDFKADLIFIDKGVPAKAFLPIFNSVLPFLTEQSFCIIGGIHADKTAEMSWNRLKNHPKSRQSLDLFFWGLIFFRKKQARENFRIRV